MSRKQNKKLEKLANDIITNCLMQLPNFEHLHEIRDYSSRRQNDYILTPGEHIENDINMLCGVDFVYRINIHVDGVNILKTVYIDTKGLTYNEKYYGSIEANGVPEFLLLQVEKYYNNTILQGWSNNTKYLTNKIVILINNRLLILDYKKLREFTNNIYVQNDTKLRSFINTYSIFFYKNLRWFNHKKYNSNYEITVQISTNELIEKSILTYIA